MRPTQRWLLLCALLAVSASPRAAVDTAISDAVLRLQIVTDGDDVAGTATLIHREDKETGAVLYLVTSARLFKDPQGGPPPRIQVARVFLGADHTLDVSSKDIFVCTGVIDVAVLRATSPGTTLVPQPLSTTTRHLPATCFRFLGMAGTALGPLSPSASGSDRRSSRLAIATHRRWSAASALRPFPNMACSASSASAMQVMRR